VGLQRKERNIQLIKSILSHKVFYEVYLLIKSDEKISKDEIIKIMKRNNLYKIDSDVTYYRRSTTVSSRCQWIFDRINEKLEN
jgi:hypothetical protein